MHIDIIGHLSQTCETPVNYAFAAAIAAKKMQKCCVGEK